MKNFIRLKSSRKCAEYAFFDLPKHMADPIFVKHKLPVIVLRDLGRVGCDYFIVICRVKAEDVPMFEQCMKELRNAMLVCGRRDYDDFCAEMGTMIEKGCA